MLKSLASVIHNYSDLSYITKKGIKEKCLCRFKIIQLLRKWSLVLMKKCGNLDHFTSVPYDLMHLPFQGEVPPMKVEEALKILFLLPFFSGMLL